MPAWMKWAIALLIGFGIIAAGFHFPWGGYILKPFFVLNCLVLIIVVLLQSGKAADLAGALGGAGSVLSQATTWCAIMFMVCAMAMVVRVDQNVEQGGQGGSILEKYSKPAPKAATPAPVKPAPAPQQPAAPQSSTPQPSTPAKP